MAKKGPKNQPKQPKQLNTANHSNTTETTPTPTTISAITVPTDPGPPADITNPTQMPAPLSPSPRKLEPITDALSIERLVGLAKDSPPDSALGIAWKYAYEEGYNNGRKSLLQNLEKKLKEKFEEGQKEGIKKGRETYYGKGIVKGEYEEHMRWLAEGHGQHCLMPVPFRDDTGTQTDTPTTTMSVSTQTSLATSTAMPEARTLVENGVSARLATTVAISVQTSPYKAHIPSLATISTQTETGMSQHLEIDYPTRVATSQSPALLENGKNSKIITTNVTTSEFSPFFAVFSSQTPSVTSSDSTISSTTTTALETRSSTASFTQKVEKVENQSIFIKTTPQPSLPSIVEPIDDVTGVQTTLPTSNDAILHLPVTSRTASSPVTLLTPYCTGHEKSAPLCAVFESQAPTESLALTTIITALETCSETAGFTKSCQNVENSHTFTQNVPEPIVLGYSKCAEDFYSSPAPTATITAFETRSAPADSTKNHQKIEISPISNKNHPKSTVSDHFNWADDVALPPISSTIPTKYPRDLSGLRSSSSPKFPFSSLQRRRRKFNKNQSHFLNSKLQYHCHHTFPGSHFYSRNPHYHSKPRLPLSVSLDWDQDPRLANLSNALRALGWVRQ